MSDPTPTITMSLDINTDLGTMIKEKVAVIKHFTRDVESEELLMKELLNGAYIRGFLAGVREGTKTVHQENGSSKHE